MYKIQTLNAISPAGLHQFSSNNYEINADCTDPDAILVRSADMHHMQFSSQLKVVGRAGAGVNNIPVNALTKLGIPVLNTPGANANAVRELVLAGMLLASRHILPAGHYVANLQGTYEEMSQDIEKNKKQFVGIELLGKTLGVIGLGNIGVKVANAAIALGMRVIGYDPTISVNRAWELSSNVHQARSIDELLAVSDFISFHIPLTKETENMITQTEINKMKPGVILLNFARDGIIKNTDLLPALKTRHIASYVSDFPNPTLDLPNVIALPHLGASTKEAEENCAHMIVKQVSDFLEKGSITYSVNFPSIEMGLSPHAIRLAIVNENIPNMVAQISSKLADAKLNIISLLNKSREDIAYTLIDVNADISESTLAKLRAIQGVIQVRKIIHST